MKYSDLPIELKKTINTTFTNMAKEAFAPLVKEGVVIFGKVNIVSPSKAPLIKSIAEQFNLPPTWIAKVVSNNAVFRECKKEIVKRRNAVFIKEYNKGKSPLEIAALYGLSQPTVINAINRKRKISKKTSYSYTSVLQKLNLGKVERADEILTKGTHSKTKNKGSYSFANILDMISKSKSSQKHKRIKPGNSDYILLRRSKKK